MYLRNKSKWHRVIITKDWQMSSHAKSYFEQNVTWLKSKKSNGEHLLW